MRYINVHLLTYLLAMFAVQRRSMAAVVSPKGQRSTVRGQSHRVGRCVCVCSFWSVTIIVVPSASESHAYCNVCRFLLISWRIMTLLIANDVGCTVIEFVQ